MGDQGAFACMAAIFRFASLRDITNDKDFTHTLSRNVIWGNVELHIGLTTGSLTSLPLIPGVRRLVAFCSKCKSAGPSLGEPADALWDVPLTIGAGGGRRAPAAAAGDEPGLPFYGLDGTSSEVILTLNERTAASSARGSGHGSGRSVST